jgi:hypothetical protein
MSSNCLSSASEWAAVKQCRQREESVLGERAELRGDDQILLLLQWGSDLVRQNVDLIMIKLYFLFSISAG